MSKTEQWALGFWNRDEDRAATEAEVREACGNMGVVVVEAIDSEFGQWLCEAGDEVFDAMHEEGFFEGEAVLANGQAVEASAEMP